METVRITGEIKSIYYSHESTGFTIASLMPVDSNMPVTIVGNTINLSPGEVLCVDGIWQKHPKFGKQLKIKGYSIEIPSDLQALKKYLASRIFKGVGEATVGKIVDTFGKETRNVLDESPHRLLEVPGIGKRRALKIQEEWIKQAGINDIMIFFQKIGIGPALSLKIYHKYGIACKQVIQENPYLLATEVEGIGFPTADRIGAQLGIPATSPQRVQAGILYILSDLVTSRGHVCYPRSKLIKEAKKILKIEERHIVDAIQYLNSQNKVDIEANGDDPYIYLPFFNFCEKAVARMIKEFVNHPRSVHTIDPKTADEWIRNDISITANEEQRKAACSSLEHKFMILTGGPGTGKTTTVNTIIRLYEETRARILLAAPTGRAAKRMSEATGYEAMTIHRLLEYNPVEGGFMRCRQNPLSCDLVIIDETSMMDIVLTYHLLDALPREATIIFVGDSDQLPSVGPGNVLGDIISSGIVPVYHLTQIHRQASESTIITNAHRINNGQMPICRTSEDNIDQDFFVIAQDDTEQAAETIRKLVSWNIPNAFGINSFDIQVLAPMYKGNAGVMNLNKIIQESISKKTGKEVKKGEMVFREGDRVIQLKNNYEKNVFNGDVGFIQHIDTQDKTLTVKYDERVVEYDYSPGSSELDEIMLAYAVSIHKSQGSEYPAVVISIQNEHHLLLQRNLLYTAVTRGKQLVIIVGSKQAIAIAVKNSQKQPRFTRLCELLGGRKDDG
jgi:exodeoxyribonuclease V alpha subunit